MPGSTEEGSHAAYLAPGRLDRAVADARDGDATAFRLLYREFQPPLLRYLRFLAGDRAEDVAARAWQRATAELRGHRGNYQAFRGWLAAIARELARDGALADRGEPGTPTASGWALAQDARAQDGTDVALRMIGELPSDEAESVLLRSVVGLDARGAAKVMGLRPREVRAAARRGLAALAGRLAVTPGQL